MAQPHHRGVYFLSPPSLPSRQGTCPSTPRRGSSPSFGGPFVPSLISAVPLPPDYSCCPLASPGYAQELASHLICIWREPIPATVASSSWGLLVLFPLPTTCWGVVALPSLSQPSLTVLHHRWNGGSSGPCK